MHTQSCFKNWEKIETLINRTLEFSSGEVDKILLVVPSQRKRLVEMFSNFLCINFYSILSYKCNFLYVENLLSFCKFHFLFSPKLRCLRLLTMYSRRKYAFSIDKTDEEATICGTNIQLQILVNKIHRTVEKRSN